MSGSTEQRLETLERELASTKRRLLIAIALALAAVLTLAGIELRDGKQEVLRVRALVVEDDSDQARAVLGGSHESGPSLVLYDKMGVKRILLAVSDDGPVATLNDVNGRPRAALAVLPTAGPGLVLYDATGNPIWSTR